MKVTVKAILPQPPEIVFAFVADMRNDPKWAPMVHDVEQIAGDGPGLGASYQFLQDMGRHQIEMTSTITAYEPPRRLAWEMDHKAMDYASTMRFEDHPKGTRLVQTNVETWTFAPWWLRLVGPALVRKQLKRQLGLLSAALAETGRAGDEG